MNDITKDTDYEGMTVNERLFVSGLLDEFDIVKENDLQRAIEILQELKVDDKSIRSILNIEHNIPKETLLKSFCNYYTTNAIKSIEEYNLSMEQIDCLQKKKRVDKIFIFSKNDLISYLKQNEKVCDNLINESYDKRSTPSSFIKEEKNQFTVGYYDNGYKGIINWSNKINAVADYLLLSWNLNRLKKISDNRI